MNYQKHIVQSGLTKILRPFQLSLAGYRDSKRQGFVLEIRNGKRVLIRKGS